MDALWISYPSRTRRFYPTARLQALATQISANNPLTLAGNEAIELLCERTGESALCGVLGSHHVEVTSTRQGRHELRYVLEVGARIGLHVSALGKALLAAGVPADALARLQARPLKQVTPHTITDLAELGGELLALSVVGPSERFRRNGKAYREALLEVKNQVFGSDASHGKAT